MEMNSNGFNLFDATAAFGHELIHVQQHIKGWLRVKNTGKVWSDGLYWKGEFYSALHLMLNGSSNCVPWKSTLGNAWVSCTNTWSLICRRLMPR